MAAMQLASLGPVRLAASSLRMRPSRLRVSRHSRALACDPHGARRLAPTSTTPRRVTRWLWRCGRLQRHRQVRQNHRRSIRRMGEKLMRAWGSVGALGGSAGYCLRFELNRRRSAWTQRWRAPNQAPSRSPARQSWYRTWSRWWPPGRRGWKGSRNVGSGVQPSTCPNF